MTYKNSVELTGIVGAARHTTVSGKRLCHFNVATNLAYKTSDGCPVIETTWHDCQYWERQGEPFPEELKRGTVVSLRGRLMAQRYTTANGEYRSSQYISVETVSVNGEGASLEMEVRRDG